MSFASTSTVVAALSSSVAVACRRPPPARRSPASPSSTPSPCRSQHAVGRRVGEAVGPVVVRVRRVGDACRRVQRHVPCAGPRRRDDRPALTDRSGCRRRCRSPARRSSTSWLSSASVAVSSSATGASLTAVTVIVTVAVSPSQAAVVRRVGEAVRPVVVRRRRVGRPTAVARDRQRAVRRRRRAHRQAGVRRARQVVDVGVVRQHVDSSLAVSSLTVSRVVGRHRRVVHRRHRHRHRRDVRVSAAVVRLVGEAVRPVVVRPPACRSTIDRRARPPPCRAPRAPRRPSSPALSGTEVVDVGVVGQHVERRRQRVSSSVTVPAVVDRHRRVVHRVDRDRHRPSFESTVPSFAL